MHFAAENGHVDTVKLLIKVGQADVNTKNLVSHSNCITKQIIWPNFDNQVIPITTYEVNKSIRKMIWGVLLIQ